MPPTTLRPLYSSGSKSASSLPFAVKLGLAGFIASTFRFANRRRVYRQVASSMRRRFSFIEDDEGYFTKIKKDLAFIKWMLAVVIAAVASLLIKTFA